MIVHYIIMEYNAYIDIGTYHKGHSRPAVTALISRKCIINVNMVCVFF